MHFVMSRYFLYGFLSLNSLYCYSRFEFCCKLSSLSRRHCLPLSEAMILHLKYLSEFWGAAQLLWQSSDSRLLAAWGYLPHCARKHIADISWHDTSAGPYQAISRHSHSLAGLSFGRALRSSLHFHSKATERCSPDCESLVLSVVRCGIRMVGLGPCT
jgi:hypothetical protein